MKWCAPFFYVSDTTQRCHIPKGISWYGHILCGIFFQLGSSSSCCVAASVSHPSLDLARGHHCPHGAHRCAVYDPFYGRELGQISLSLACRYRRTVYTVRHENFVVKTANFGQNYCMFTCFLVLSIASSLSLFNFSFA